jgi:hypothetical protein
VASSASSTSSPRKVAARRCRSSGAYDDATDESGATALGRSSAALRWIFCPSSRGVSSEQ